MKINLADLQNSTFRFYIEDNFRDYLFNKLRIRYSDWRIVAKRLNINTRHLFGMRRGWEIRENVKLRFLINSLIIKKLSELTNVGLDKIEKNITCIKHGQSNKIVRINFPLKININKLKPNSIKAALFDYKCMQIYLDKLNSHMKTHSRELIIKPKISKKYLETLKARGLSPYLSDRTLSYRIPGTNKFKKVFIPNELIFNQVFAKQFGKWIGDRCGGPRKIGVANKDYLFVKEFEEFIKNTLKQKEYNLYLTYNNKFIPDRKLKKLVGVMKLCNSQYGDYAFRVEVSNSLLKREVFDYIESNLLKILLNSKKEIRYAYYAGLIEAEGSIDKTNTITIAFGANLSKPREYSRIQRVLYRSLDLFYLLKLDGYNPRLSRKVCFTYKSKIIKYDIVLLGSSETRLGEVKFIKSTIGKFLTHKDKLKKLYRMEEQLKKKESEGKRKIVQPEINIGLVGHQ